jgi:hypothetical protein
LVSLVSEQNVLRVDATIVGESLGIEPSLVHIRMREGKITSLVTASKK